MKQLAAVVVGTLIVGCGGDTPPSEPPDEVPCAVGERMIAGGVCIRPGVLPESCAEGFSHDGVDACAPILPPPCPRGQMALPGETACRPVMSCGGGPWGDIPVEPGIIYVDAQYVGVSDGTALQPFATIAEAVAAAPSGAMVAIARGTYPESVAILGKAVRLWGVCPDEVEISSGAAAAGCPPAAVCIGQGGDGSEIHGVALSGTSIGVTMSGAEDVLIDRVWVREVGSDGVDIESVLGATSAAVIGSLIEHGAAAGMLIAGAEVTISDSLVRGVVPGSDAAGAVIEPCNADLCAGPLRSTAHIERSVLELSDSGLLVVGSDVSIDASVVRNMIASGSETGGRGITVQACTSPQCNAPMRATLAIARTVVDGASDAGILVAGSDVTLDDSVVRGTLPAIDQRFGTGLTLQPLCGEAPFLCTERGVAMVRHSVFEHNLATGVFVTGSDATFEAVVVRNTLPQVFDQRYGTAANVQLACSPTACDPGARAVAVVRESAFEDSSEVGLLVWGSDVSVERSLIQAVLPRASDGFFGDGIAVQLYRGTGGLTPASAAIASSRVVDAARSGVSTFGASIALGGSSVECAPIAIDAEIAHDQSYTLEDEGGNRCGCGHEQVTCKAVSSGLAPPDPLGPPEG